MSIVFFSEDNVEPTHAARRVGSRRAPVGQTMANTLNTPVLIASLRKTLQFGFSMNHGTWYPGDSALFASSGAGLSNVVSTPGHVVRIDTAPQSVNGWKWATGTRTDPPATGFVMAVVCRRAGSVSGNYDRVFCKYLQDSVPSGCYGYLLEATTGIPYCHLGAPASSGVGSGVGAGLSLTEFEVLLMQHTGTVATLWRNGVAVAQVTTTVPGTNPNEVHIGCAPASAPCGAAVDVEMAFIDGRCWSDDEVRTWSANRYNIFEPQLRSRWIGVPITVVGAAPQLLRPVSDIAVNGWLPSTGAVLYAMIDEATADAADYIYSPDNPTTQMAEVKMGAGSPGAYNTCTTRVQLQAMGLDTNFDVTLVQGTRVLDSWTENVTVAAGLVTREHVSTGILITDATDLRPRIVARA